MDNVSYPISNDDVVDVSSDEESSDISSETAEYGSPSRVSDSSEDCTDMDFTESLNTNDTSDGCSCAGCCDMIRSWNVIQVNPSNVGIALNLPDEGPGTLYQNTSTIVIHEVVLLPPVILNEERNHYEDSYSWSPTDDDELEALYDEMSPRATPVLEDRELVNFLENEPPAQEASLCTICLERQPSVTFFGCQHVSTCSYCIRGLQIMARGAMIKCPLCNLPSGYIIGRLP